MRGLWSVGCRARMLSSPYGLAGRGENEVPCGDRLLSVPCCSDDEEEEEPAFSFEIVPSAGTGGSFFVPAPFLAASPCTSIVAPLSSAVSRFFAVLNVKNVRLDATSAAPAARTSDSMRREGLGRAREATGGRWARREERIAAERGLGEGAEWREGGIGGSCEGVEGCIKVDGGNWRGARGGRARSRRGTAV